MEATGCLTIGEVLDLMRTARADVEHQSWPMLFDARGCTTTATEADVEAAVIAVREAVRTQGPRGHVALVTEDDILFARMLLYETGCADIGVRVIRAFRDLADGERWLNILSAARYFSG